MISKIKTYIATMGWLGLQSKIMRLDLQKHGLIGLGMSTAFYLPCYLILYMDKIPSFIVATMLSFAVSYFKESGDSIKPKNKFDWLDLSVTVIFTIIGSLLYMIFM